MVVNHGYPPLYNAGSEIYAQSVARTIQSLNDHSSVVVARCQDPFVADYLVRQEDDAFGDVVVPVYLINHGRENIRFQNDQIDEAYSNILIKERPDVVHFNHLNHLSVGLVKRTHELGVPIVFTLHDFWLMCPRGQFLRWGLSTDAPFSECYGQEDVVCARECFSSRFKTGTESSGSNNEELDYWTKWVASRMTAVREAVGLVDKFISPSKHLLNRFLDAFPNVKRSNCHVLDYGFGKWLGSAAERRRNYNPDRIVFGFTGRHDPSKGIDLLIRSFAGLVHGSYDTDSTSSMLLRIWGRPNGQLTESLKRLAADLNVDKFVEWRPEYENRNVCKEVFNHLDILCVPSIWDENSPLVIHEAQQFRVPVLTSDCGGMAEFVRDGINGLLFRHRDVGNLTDVMRKAVQLHTNNNSIASLGKAGYLYSDDGNVLSMDQHANELLKHFYALQESRNAAETPPVAPGPWRITFDTNPDLCNLSCTMCEEHSVHSPIRQAKTAATPKRRMSIDLVRSVVKKQVLYGLKEVIPTTMGEPLLWADFPEFLEILRDHNVKLNLTTNGTFPRLGSKAWAELIVPVSSDVKISWNGFSSETQEKIMIGSRFRRQLANLQKFLEIRDGHLARGLPACTVTLQVTFMESNFREFPDLIRLAADLGVDRVKGHHLWVLFPEVKLENMRRSAASRASWNEVVRECKLAAEKHRRPDGTLVRLQNFELIGESDQADPVVEDSVCPFLGKEAWVNWQGRFDPCCAPNDQRSSLGTFGNLTNLSLMDVWNSDQYQSLLQTYKSKPVCRQCNMRVAPPSRSFASRVSKCRTHHIDHSSGQRLYERQFEQVLPFHDPPGLAPVSDNTGAFHIHSDGSDAYAERFGQTFGFYDGLSAVVDSENNWFHVGASGQPVYARHWSWCGNFQQCRATVRDFNNLYFHINELGGIIGEGLYSYAGDFREGFAVVRDKAGLCKLVDASGKRVAWAESMTLFELYPFHKGIARAKDSDGWFFVSDEGTALTGERRFKALEDLYNGQALATRLDGFRVVVNCHGDELMPMLPESKEESKSIIHNLSIGYWASFALKLALRHRQLNDQLQEHVYSAIQSLGIVRERKQLLDENVIVKRRAEYFLGPQLAPWLHAIADDSSLLVNGDADFFTRIACSESDLFLTHQVLQSFAEEDWDDLPTVLGRIIKDVSLGTNGAKVADVGGGLGHLCYALAAQHPEWQFSLVDRPEVVELIDPRQKSDYNNVQVIGCDFFQSVPSGMDCYICTRVLHDWNDDSARRLLQVIRENGHQDSKLIVVDRLICPGQSQKLGLLSLNMFLVNGGKERNHNEWIQLFTAAGWTIESEEKLPRHHFLFVLSSNNINKN